KHINDRETWGHSMIIDPWGNILDCVEKGPGFAIADIDLEKQKTLRKNFPCLDYRVLN
ncbi:MAG: carbon-nitrogen hydrolase family protein, partial [Gammaproteobacteria bacterium]|nr:carbon-nitrogen hydrolase family protein [Gammaproteobacteria bacterium]